MHSLILTANSTHMLHGYSIHILLNADAQRALCTAKAHPLQNDSSVRRGQWIWSFQWQTRASLTCAPRPQRRYFFGGSLASVFIVSALHRELRWMERWTWLARPGRRRRGGEEKEGGWARGDAGGAVDGCRVRMGTRVYGWKHLRHVTSDCLLKENTTEFVEGGSSHCNSSALVCVTCLSWWVAC